MKFRQWSIVIRFEEWRADRKRKRHATLFRQGFDYADDVLRSGMYRPVVHLENLVDTARIYGDYNHFDAGIEARLRLETVTL